MSTLLIGYAVEYVVPDRTTPRGVTPLPAASPERIQDELAPARALIGRPRDCPGLAGARR